MNYDPPFNRTAVIENLSFEIVPARQTPNEETRRVLIAAEAKELGLIPDDAEIFNDADRLMAFLEEE